MLPAASLDRRVKLQRQSTLRDALGQPLATWNTVATVWANVQHLNGMETLRAESPTSTVRASVRMRWRRDVDASMRVVMFGRDYRITAVLPGPRNEYIDLACEVSETADAAA